MKQRPSVGRVVHYVAFGTPGGEYPAGACRAALITEVNTPVPGTVIQLSPDGVQMSVGLCILNPTGMFYNRSVPYDGSAKPAPGTWHWPEQV